MGKKKYDWKYMTEREKKFYKKKYMREYYAQKRAIGGKTLKKKCGFTRKMGEVVVSFQ